ncbi:hypothetical protein [Thomasclavelia spiroformis]|uniref:hypothetical protein n=1 Tax=Thomasclavelia spiroformis TaxID=29348 RepID=UPI0039A167FA
MSECYRIHTDYNEKVKWLKSYRDKYDRLEFVKNQIEGVQAIKYTPSINGPKKSINAYIEEKTQLERELRSIEECINHVQDLNARTTLGYKYLQFKTLSEIADCMNYSISQIKRFHKNGINMIPFEPQ